MPLITPESFLNLPPDPSSKVLVFLGDSITYGVASSNYVNLLNASLGNSFYLINAGVDGDLTWNALQRLSPLIACNPDAIFILLGTNDVNASLSPIQNAEYVTNKDLPQSPDLEWFIVNYTNLFTKLKQSTKSAIFALSLPTIGEDLDSYELQQSSLYSNKIKEICSNLHITYIPLHETMLKQLQSLSDNRSQSKFFTDSFPFTLHNDELHMNDKGATMIADLILSYVHDYL